MNAFGEQLHPQRAGHQPAQRRRDPELRVVFAARVETDDERRRAYARLQVLDVLRQVHAARLLRALDQHCHAAVRHALLLQRLERRDRTVNAVAVVAAAAAVQFAVLFVDGRVRAQAFVPAAVVQRRLLVKMSIYFSLFSLFFKNKHAK